MSPTSPRVTSRRPLLTNDEELALAERIEKGDTSARNELVLRNTGLVYMVVDTINIATSSMSRADLIGCGNIGLLLAVNNFDCGKGTRFSTFATQCIRRQIMEHINNTDRSIRVPSDLINKCRKIRSATKCRWNDDAEEIARDTGYNPNDVRKLAYVAREPLSLDMRVGDQITSIIDRLSAPQNANSDPETAVFAKLKKETVGTLLGLLDDNTRMTLMRRYGLFGSAPMTDKEQGSMLGKKATIIKQRVRSALKRLKMILDSNPELAKALLE